ncbi:pyrroline-5-carboxylate reductase [Picrophilus oshimae]|uniref:Pyrroline-5-carboxylate reductase n=1 Tax=Picrophilus torridus (strain ATCC 700027 / DSM 9790 / JCM 10055 / NBRC 100828 / KAW 2/3) TaxID=1122961 RepID=A0A8G2L7C1_PICTO|nr:pyrroline-5-carboxylate reductase [Picrophilus oshimae]SMD30928.1 pyrroline-5-carboxylate reductase [Picrophilus oshimae DSM 9789]
MKISIIGAGTIGRAMAEALKDDYEIGLSSRDFSKLESWSGGRFKLFKNNAENAAYGDLIILSVKPFNIDDVLNEIKDNIKNKIIVSFLAGINIDYIESYAKTSIFRAMPNLPIITGDAITAVAYKNADENTIKIVDDIFKKTGECIFIDEKSMDAVTGLSGSGPAFISIMIDSMIVAGIRMGLSRDTARKLTLKTFEGTARLMEKTGLPPSEIRDRVMTPAGTAAAGVFEIENGNIRTTIARAVEASTKRSMELKRK